MPNTDKPSEVVQAIIDLLGSKFNDWGGHSKEDVFYGDQNRYYRFPSISVESNDYRSDLYQTGLQQLLTYEIAVFVYHAELSDQSFVFKTTDERAEQIRDVLETDRTLGGLVVHGHVTNIVPGQATRGGSLLAATRLIWTGTARAQI